MDLPPLAPLLPPLISFSGVMIDSVGHRGYILFRVGQRLRFEQSGKTWFSSWQYQLLVGAWPSWGLVKMLGGPVDLSAWLSLLLPAGGDNIRSSLTVMT